MKKLILRFLPFFDFLLVPLVYPSAWVLEKVRRLGVQKLPRSKAVLLHVGVFPVRNHYYEPQFDFREAHRPLSDVRNLPGVDWNVDGQLKTLAGLGFAGELANTPTTKTDDLDFHFNNGSFESGDAEIWYQLIRATKPKRIFEIGSGNSTLMAIKAIRKNREEDPDYACRHVCIEPYEMPWLEKSGVSVMRQKVEEVDIDFFKELEANDILFIDSSHMIRPQGDVLFEFLEILPALNVGVLVHVHDIFSPRNYPSQWVEEGVAFWNEQYLLEAFLSHNASWKVVASLNYLQHNYFAELKRVAPFLSVDREPGSFYMQRSQ